MVETADPGLVRLATRHFYDLQGLRLAALAPAYAAMGWAWLGTGRELLVFVAGASAMVLAFGALRPVDRFYARFGRVRLPHHRLMPFWFGIIFVVLLRLQELTASGVPSIVWLLGSLYPLWLAADGWPLRWWHLATFASMVYVAFGRVAYPDPPAFAWMAPRMWAFSAAMLVTGLADHFLLLRTLHTTRGIAEVPVS